MDLQNQYYNEVPVYSISKISGLDLGIDLLTCSGAGSR